MSDIEIHRSQTPTIAHESTGLLVGWAQEAKAANQLAVALASTTFVPAHFRGKEGDATAAILMGAELGLSPLAAFRSIYVVHGTPALYARGMVALAQSQGHEVWTEKSTDTEVVVKGRRKGSQQTETAKWTIARAQKAGYTSNKKYATNPEEMLYSKAAAEVCRKIAADVLAGVPHSVEELELEQGGPTATVARTQGTTKVSRRKPEPEVVENAPAESDGITDEQRKILHALVNDLGLDRDQKLAGIAATIGREVESSNDLTKAEASRVIDSLQATLASRPGAAEPIEGELWVEDGPQ